LKEEDAGGRKNGAREKETCTENQRDAILSSLETDKSYGGEYESEQGTNDLQESLKDRIGLNGDMAKPESGQEQDEKATDMRKEDRRATAAVSERSLAHVRLI
jgi:hypothetical protein